MKEGMFVTRKKYNHDIIFRIVSIDGNMCNLRGEYVRLLATASIDDLVEIDMKEIKVEIKEDELRVNNDVVKGTVLHIDGDNYYLNKCLSAYRANKIPAIGVHMKESDIKDNITNLLIKYNPDILVITGHDKYDKDKDEYENSINYIDAVKKARIYQPNKDALIIFAGACQSYYEGIIESGANFASSINRVNINVLDPSFIAIQIANSKVEEYIDVKKILSNTVSKGRGLGGIDTKGVARKIYIG